MWTLLLLIVSSTHCQDDLLIQTSDGPLLGGYRSRMILHEQAKLRTLFVERRAVVKSTDHFKEFPSQRLLLET